jgi:hypothetical protein
MIAQSNTAGKAGTVARAFRGGGKTDWSLPSRDELNALCKWAYNDTNSALCDNTMGTLSLTNGGFASGSYCSSSEYDASNAWYQTFNDGDQFTNNKTSTYLVRPVRAF